MEPEARREWSPEETLRLMRALRSPRGRYSVKRASQLAGVPERTLYDWAKSGVVVPDYRNSRPKQWSYRDLVFLRMTAWLRTRNMPRPQAVDRVDALRAELDQMTEGDTFETIRSDGRSVLRGHETVDRVTGEALLDPSFLVFIDEFELVVPAEVDELGSRRLWGPDLVTPAPRVTIDPWVMGGDPCVMDTRIPTSTIFALQEQRGLQPTAIVALYPGALTEHDVLNARTLERSLRSHQKLAA